MLVVTPPSLDFGAVWAGTVSPAKSLVVANMGEKPVTFSVISSSDTFPIDEIDGCSADPPKTSLPARTLKSGEIQSYCAFFSPEEVQAYTGTIEFVVAGAPRQSKKVPLRGRGSHRVSRKKRRP